MAGAGKGRARAGAGRAAPAETTRTKPYQDNSLVRLPVHECFEQLLPDRPYCTDDPRHGLLIRIRQRALAFSHIQLNRPTEARWLAFDVDRSTAAFAWEDGNLPPPNVIAVNPENGHAHLLWALHEPVHASDASRQAPLRYLADIERGMSRRLVADRGYAGLIAKNPRSLRWRVSWPAPFAYNLGQLDADLSREDKMRPAKLSEQFGFGRNFALFEEVRQIAYNEVLGFKRQGFSADGFRLHLQKVVQKLNLQFVGSPAGPLPLREVRCIARSVARWCYRQFTPARFSALQSHRAQTRTRRNQALIRKLRHGGT